jgi:hypothetical protein
MEFFCSYAYVVAGWLLSGSCSSTAELRWLSLAFSGHYWMATGMEFPMTVTD